MTLSFSGKRVAISGGAIGFGREMALHFASLGAEVHVCDIRALAGLEHDGIVSWQVDLCDRQAAASWIADVSHNGSRPVDILVNNAGGVASWLMNLALLVVGLTPSPLALSSPMKPRKKQWDNFGEERQQQLLNSIALCRLGTARDISNAAVWLASDLSSFIHGQIISVDGGS